MRLPREGDFDAFFAGRRPTSAMWACYIAAGACLWGALDDDLSYGFYTLLRLLTTIAALMAIAGLYLYRPSWKLLGVPLAVVAILFNPIIPVHLAREDWQVIDLLTGTFLFVVAQGVMVKEPKADSSP